MDDLAIISNCTFKNHMDIPDGIILFLKNPKFDPIYLSSVDPAIPLVI